LEVAAEDAYDNTSRDSVRKMQKIAPAKIVSSKSHVVAGESTHLVLTCPPG